MPARSDASVSRLRSTGVRGAARSWPGLGASVNGLLEHHLGHHPLYRKREAKRNPTAFAILSPDSAAVGRHDGATDGKPEAHTAVAALANEPVKLLEHARLLSGRYARAPIGNLDDHLVPRGCHPNFDRVGAILCCVLEQIDQDLLDQNRIEGNQ